MGIALARKLRSDFGCDRDRGGDSLLFSAAVQNSDRLNATDTGDQVFVDKCSYNFVKPHNGDVFVFRTNGIPAIRPDPIAGPPFYIKRLAGLPGDQLRIDPPFLYINSKKAEGYGFERVM